MTYLDDDADLIRRCLPAGTKVPENSERLFRLYAVLMRAKRTRTTASDVHNAWTAWQQELDPEHEALRPYQQLPRDVQVEDEPFLAAIQQAASVRIDARASTSEQRIRSTFPDLDTWVARFRDAYRPAPNSPLAVDDLDWPPLSISQIATSSMIAASEHLDAFRVRVESRVLSYLADETLLRTAILSAAQAVWLLGSDDRDERLARARTLALHIDTEHMKYLRDLKPFGPDTNRDLVAERIEERLADLGAKRKEAGQRAGFEATNTIRTAVGYLSEDKSHADEVIINWRSGSGAAHGLAWVALGRASNRHTSQPDEHGLVEIEVSADIDALASTYMSAYWLLHRAHALLDRRGSA